MLPPAPFFYMNPNSPTLGVKTATKFSLPLPKIPGLPAPVSATHFLADISIQKPEEIISGLIHKGTKCVIASVSKAGKSVITTDLGVSVATGTKWLHYDTVKSKVLQINLELPPAFMKDRLETLVARRQLQSIENLVVWNLRGKTADSDALMANIIREVDGKGYGLIIIDGIYKLMVGRSENTAGAVGVLCNQLERLAERRGAAVLYTHHFPKGNAKKKAVIDRMSGSGVFARDADTIITLTPHAAPDCYTVEMILRNLPPQPSFVVQFDYPAMVEREDLDPEDVAMDDTPIDTDEGLMELLKDKPLASWEWQNEALGIGLSRATFYRIKAKLLADGYVQFDSGTKTWNLLN